MTDDAPTAPAPANAMRCDFCNINFADRQPGSLCPMCFHELSLVTMTAAPAPELAPESIDYYAIRLLVAAGHIPQEKVDEAREIARRVPFTYKPDPAAPAPAADAVEEVMRLADEYAMQSYDGSYEKDALRAAVEQMEQEANAWRANARDSGVEARAFKGRAERAEREAADLRRLIADDAYAISFQTMGQYRTALLKAIDAAKEQK